MEAVTVKTIEAILHPHKTEKTIMNWLIYIFQYGGGIVWILAYWSLYFITIQFLVDTYMLPTVIGFGLIGLLLSIATLYNRLKWMPDKEKELMTYYENQRSDYQNVIDEFNKMFAVYDGLQRDPTLVNAFGEYHSISVAFRKKYFPREKDYE